LVNRVASLVHRVFLADNRVGRNSPNLVSEETFHRLLRLALETKTFGLKPVDMVDDWQTYWSEGMRKFQTISELEENETRLKPLGKLAFANTGTNGTATNANGTV